MTNLNQPEPTPTPNQLPAMWPLVIADMQARDAEGRQHYGTPLQPFNKRNPAVDKYQEALDLVVYFRQQLFEDALSERQAIKALLTDIINAPVLSRTWGDEFCPVCEKPTLTDDDCEDLDRFIEMYGIDSPEYQEKLQQSCDGRCYEDRRLIWYALCGLRTKYEVLQRALKDAVLQEIAQMELEDG